MYRTFLCATLATIGFVPVTSSRVLAACATPVGEKPEGSIIYNLDHKTPQYCDGAQWVGMGTKVQDTVNRLSCNTGQTIKWNGEAWTCGEDAAGTPLPDCPVGSQLISAGGGNYECGSLECDLPWGGTIGHGSSVMAYQTASVPYGDSCTDETRTCSNGSLSGSYTNQNCSVQAAQNCQLDGRTVAHGASFTFYSAEESPNCSGISRSRTCTDGTLSGSGIFQYASCETLTCENGPVGTVCDDGAVYAGTSDGNRIYVAPADQGAYPWNNGSENWTTTNAISFSEGLANTNILVALSDASSPYRAAGACRNRGADWYLPAKDELNLLYVNRGQLGAANLPTSDIYYLSSSEYVWEYGRYGAWGQRFSDGFQAISSKSSNRPVRCVRR